MIFLTKEEAVYNHRKLWNWIAEETEKRKEVVLKEQYFSENGFIHIKNDCYCCEYEREFLDDDCNHCPILWVAAGEEYKYCVARSSPYMKWIIASEIVQDYRECAKYAREIANLPAREDA